MRLRFLIFSFLLATGCAGQVNAQSVPDSSWTFFAGGFSGISAIRADMDGAVWVVESSRNRLVKLNPAGLRTDSLGKLGFGSYAFNEPVQLDITNGLKLYVLDKGNERVQIFDRRLQFLSSVASVADGNETVTIVPAALAVDVLARLFVFDRNSGTVYRYKSNGQPDVHVQVPEEIRRLPEPLFSGADDRLFVTGKNAKSVFILNGDFLQTGLMLIPDPVRDVNAGADSVFVLTAKDVRIHSLRGNLGRTLPHPFGEKSVSVSVSAAHVFVASGKTVYRQKR